MVPIITLTILAVMFYGSMYSGTGQYRECVMFKQTSNKNKLTLSILKVLSSEMDPAEIRLIR